MLYVFHVDTGRMIKFDMNVALSSVQNLKETIERLHGIPAPNIVLLVSGGEMLTLGTLVCSYSAGTDTNPIYMFSTVDVKPQPWPSIEPDIDFTEQVERCLDLPATYSTVVTRAALAQQIYDLAREEEGICERLVHEQHLQQQGWSAVIANMEDLTEEFRHRYESFSKSFNEHLKKRSEYLELLGQFNKDLDNLSQIPILPALMQNAEEEFHGFDEYLDNDEVFSKSQNQQSSVIEQQQQQQEQSQQQEQQKPEGENQESLQRKEQEDPHLGKEGREDSNPKESSTERSGGGTEIATQQQIQIQTQKGRTLTLLQWISAKENHNTPRVMSEECFQGLKMFDEDKLEKVKQEVQHIIRVAEQEEIKEIKGLEDRLCGLEKLMFQLRKHVQEQKELSTAFQQNQSRANNLGDASILPDLCASHRSQLLVMLSNHKTIRDFRRRISRAKDELGANLEKRLKFIVTIENKMSELDNNLLFYHRCLRRIERHLNIIQQIHQTPDIYVSAVTEVIRRRIFSGEFIQWASTLACDFYVIHNDEMSRRQQFNANFEGHFLNTLFPGLHDMPPSFANETPIVFDEHLPHLTKNDIELLSTFLPELTSKMELPDMGSVIEFFTLRSGAIKSAEDNKNSSTTSGKLQSICAAAVGGTGAILHRPIDIHSHLKDGFESETDTEEFEKVGQSANEKHIKPSAQTTSISTSTSENVRETNSTSTSMDPLPEKRTVETLTEENLGETRSEVERLKSLLGSSLLVSHQFLKIVREQLQLLKDETASEKEVLQKKLAHLSESLRKIKEFSENHEEETTRQLIGKYERQIDEIEENSSVQQNRFKEMLDEKSEVVRINAEIIRNMEQERDTLKEEISAMKQTIESLQEQIRNAEMEKEKTVNECRERLMHEHKNELESLRCRFRLMTSMERSPSDTSLEKIEKPDMIEITYHESILNQIKEELNKEKELAIKAAIEEEKLKWAFENVPKTSLTTTNDVEDLKKVIEEKIAQFDQLKESEMLLYKENNQLKMKLGQLANEEGSDKSWLKDKVEILKKEKNRLEEELNKEKSRRLEMETSFAPLKVSLFGSHVEPNVGGGSRSRMSASQSVVRQGVTTESCSKGDIVFVVWNIRHGQFTLVQDSSNLYFVHGDSLSVLNLRLPLAGDGDVPIPFFAIGRVVDKEYCQARKDENRYKVAKGTKFYRVKLQPLVKSESSRWHQRRERLESTPASTSVSRSTSKQHLIDSFAQTVDFSMISKDIVDSPSNLKERTISISSTAEEEEEPLSLLSDRCYKYTSLSEEDETTLGGNAESTTSSNTNSDSYNSIGLFTLIEPLLSPLSMSVNEYL